MSLHKKLTVSRLHTGQTLEWTRCYFFFLEAATELLTTELLIKKYSWKLQQNYWQNAELRKAFQLQKRFDELGQDGQAHRIKGLGDVTLLLILAIGPFMYRVRFGLYSFVPPRSQ